MAQLVLLSPHDVRLQEKEKEEYLDQKSENRDSRKEGHEAVVRTAFMKAIAIVRVRVIKQMVRNGFHAFLTALTPRHDQICNSSTPRLRACFHNRDF